MDVGIIEITENFNNRLKEFDKNEIWTYMRLMQYRMGLYRAEKIGDSRTVQEYKEKAFEMVKQTNMLIPSNINNIDEIEQIALLMSKSVFSLIKEYQNAIKQYYQDNRLDLYSVRGHKHDTITRSKNIVNQYEAERGDWVFATSTPKSENAYRIRSAGCGMHGLGSGEYIFFSNTLHLQDGKLMLNAPAYFYTLKVDKFMPVVRINNTEENQNNFMFVFGKEWTSDQDIQGDDIIDVEEYTDVTDLLNNLQIFSTTDRHTIRSLDEAGWKQDMKRHIIKDGIKAGTVSYWNLALNRNVNEFYKEKYVQDKTINEQRIKEDK